MENNSRNQVRDKTLPQKKIRRKNYLIGTRFQLKYTGLILLFMFGVAWLAGYTVYYTGWMLMGEKLSNVYPQGRLVAIMQTINATLFLRLFLVTPLVIMISIFLSHKIAGPTYRMQKFLKGVAGGDLRIRLKLRKHDELQDLADAINEMTDDLKSRLHRIKGLVNMADLELERLRIILGKQVPDVNSVKAEVETLASSIKELDDHLSEYRLTTVED